MAYFFGGKQLEPGKPFSAGGTMFPGNYLDLSTLEEKKALGITEQEDPEPFRIAGDGPTPSTEENSLTNTTNTTNTYYTCNSRKFVSLNGIINKFKIIITR